MVEIDQPKKMNTKDMDPREKGRVRHEPNDELQKIQINGTQEVYIHRIGIARSYEGQT